MNTTRRRRENLERKLIEASIAGDIHTISILIMNGVDANCADERGMTPLHHACLADDLPAARFLVGEKRMELGFYSRDEAVRTPERDAASELIMNVSDVNAKNNRGSRPMHIAALKGGKGMIAILSSHGGSIEARDGKGKTPLVEAACYDNFRALEEFIRAGSDPNAPDYDGMRALHYAANNGNIAAIKFLKKAGALPMLQNNEGNLPFELALWQGHEAAARLLRI